MADTVLTTADQHRMGLRIVCNGSWTYTLHALPDDSPGSLPGETQTTPVWTLHTMRAATPEERQHWTLVNAL